MPALPPKLGKNPTPEEVESYREQLRRISEKEKPQKAIEKMKEKQRTPDHKPD